MEEDPEIIKNMCWWKESFGLRKVFTAEVTLRLRVEEALVWMGKVEREEHMQRWNHELISWGLKKWESQSVGNELLKGHKHRVPFLSSRVMTSRLWDVMELGSSFPEADLEKTIPMQVICYGNPLGETSMGLGEVLWGREEIRQGCNFMRAVPVSLEAKLLERWALTLLNLSAVSHRPWEWKSFRHRPGWRASPSQFSEGWRWKPLVEASRAQVGKVSYESEPNSNNNKN